MEIDPGWAAIIITLAGAIITAFYSLYKLINDSVINVSILKHDVDLLGNIMDGLDDHIVTIWQTTDKINSNIDKNTKYLQKHISNLDSRIDVIELAHMRQHNENLRERKP